MLFAFGECRIREFEKGHLDTVARVLEEHPKMGLLIVGHTDSIGPAPYNWWLSEQRAKSVETYLSANPKISKKRLVSRHCGESKRLVCNDTDEHRSANRRTEFYLIPPDLRKANGEYEISDMSWPRCNANRAWSTEDTCGRAPRPTTREHLKCMEDNRNDE